MADVDWERIGSIVRKRREALGLAQNEAGPSSATWRKVEHAVDPPYSPRTLSQIAQALEWTDDSFDRMMAGGDPVEVDAVPDLAELMEVSRAMRSEIREVREMLRAIHNLLPGGTPPSDAEQAD